MALFGIALLPTLAITGAMLDFGRMEIARSEARAALDSAVLSGCNAYFASTSDRQTAIDRMILANFDPARYGMATPQITTTITQPQNSVLSPGQLDMTIRVRAESSVPSTLLGIAGIESLPVVVQSECTRTQGELEVLLVLDTTGSMGTNLTTGVRRIDALRTATVDFINILYSQTPTGTTNSNLRVGIMPYSTTVRLRDPVTNASYLANNDFRAGSPPSHGCIEERITTSTIGAVSSSTSIPTVPSDAYDLQDTASVSTDDRTKWKDYQGSACPSATLLPAVRLQTELVNYANANLNNPTGNTHTENAMMWAQRVLSPQLPIASAFPYRHAFKRKVVVLMTDGMIEVNAGCNNWTVHGRITCDSNGNRTGVGAPRTTLQVPEYSNNNGSWNQKLNNRLRMACHGIKHPATSPGADPAVRVFVVTFGAVTGRLASEEWLYRECATPGDYYNVQSAAQLRNAFQTIASTLATSRLSL
jgi:hypothetical protein